MKIFISQKMRNKTQKKIEIERGRIKNEFLVSPIHFKVYGGAFYSQDFIQSYKPELKSKDPITALSQSLGMLAEADIVLVPKVAEQNVRGFIHTSITQRNEGDYEPWLGTIDKFDFDDMRGCEFELLIALSYGKKVYTYDDNYTFEEV